MKYWQLQVCKEAHPSFVSVAGLAMRASKTNSNPSSPIGFLDKLNNIIVI